MAASSINACESIAEDVLPLCAKRWTNEQQVPVANHNLEETHHSWRRPWILRLVGTTPSTLAAQVLDTEVSPNCVHRTADELVLVCVAALLHVWTHVQEGLIVDDDAPVVHAAGVAVGAIRQF